MALIAPLFVLMTLAASSQRLQGHALDSSYNVRAALLWLLLIGYRYRRVTYLRVIR